MINVGGYPEYRWGVQYCGYEYHGVFSTIKG